GRDGVGTVIDVGEDADEWALGDRALLLRSDVGVGRHGTFAEKVAVPVESLTTIPPGWSEQQAAAAPLVYLTAYQALTQFGELPPQQIILITGASGGVGVAVIHLARAMGHTVVAMSRGAAKVPALLGLGAHAVFDPNDPTWRKKMKQQLTGRRVNLAIDNIGGALFSDVIDSLDHDGKVSCVGRLAGPVPQFNTASLFFRRITIRGVHVGDYTPPEAQAAWAATLKLLDAAGVKPVIDRVFPFEQLIDAFERLRQGPLGKVLIEVQRLSS
ncbi:MAG: NADPH:quinone reductase, partial [Humisphaera sp.]|nr:NADPH:quinone reductase [Humisphaera sp.]